MMVIIWEYSISCQSLQLVMMVIIWEYSISCQSLQLVMMVIIWEYIWKISVIFLNLATENYYSSRSL